MNYAELKSFYQGRRVFVTGHSGFKGSWLSLILLLLGAKVYGYSLPPETEPCLYELLGLKGEIRELGGDVRDFSALQKAVTEAEPELIFHLAAQPIVRESYRFPRETYETNVMGTVNLLEALRFSSSARSFLNVTTDKVYENRELPEHAFSEEEKLDGFDPYSNSKSCSELVTHSYKSSFFSGESALRISTARAGNVIGGGDFAKDRIIPDCVRDTVEGRPIRVRNPFSTRPYQHVLEPLLVYLTIAAKQEGYQEESGKTESSEGARYADYYNVGPDESDAITTGELAELFVKSWGEPASWESRPEEKAPHEASYLRLNCEKLRERLRWEPRWQVRKAVEETVLWYRAWHEGRELRSFTEQQILHFLR